MRLVFVAATVSDFTGAPGSTSSLYSLWDWLWSRVTASEFWLDRRLWWGVRECAASAWLWCHPCRCCPHLLWRHRVNLCNLCVDFFACHPSGRRGHVGRDWGEPVVFEQLEVFGNEFAGLRVHHVVIFYARGQFLALDKDAAGLRVHDQSLL